ncbi:unnamed protein product, partial [Meganyctiphanes norvegica]
MKPPNRNENNVQVPHMLSPPLKDATDTIVGTQKAPGWAWSLWLKVCLILSSLAVEPAMLLDGMGFSVMIVYVENLQMDKICRVNLNYTDEVCDNLNKHKEESIRMQQDFSVFNMYNGMIMSFIPLFFILFVGAWSDKYGRKVPLLMAMIGHFGHSTGYFIISQVPNLPVEHLLISALFDSLGGGTPSFLTAANAYICDVTSEKNRTMRVGMANSIWFLGGPIGTLIGTFLYKNGGYAWVFGVAATMQIVACIYLCFLPESHGPFAKNHDVDELEVTSPHHHDSEAEESEEHSKEVSEKDSKITIGRMIKDFFHFRRIMESFKTTFKRREGHVRAFIMLLIFSNLLRRLGRGAYVYLFTRATLNWRATDYGLWVTYKNLVTSVGSLVAVPLLSKGFNLNDNILAMLGGAASIFDYLLYGLVNENTEYLMWIAPVGALLVNSAVIAIRSMLSKLVQPDELGKISAVLGALDGLMPMVSFSLYTLVYHATVNSFPGAQFFFGLSANLLMTIIIIFIILCERVRSYSVEDLNEDDSKNTIQSKSIHFYNEEMNHHVNQYKTTVSCEQPSNITVMILAAENFHIATPKVHRRSKRLAKRAQINNLENLHEQHEDRNSETDIGAVLSKVLTMHNTYETKPVKKNSDKLGLDNLAYVTTEHEFDNKSLDSGFSRIVSCSSMRSESDLSQVYSEDTEESSDGAEVSTGTASARSSPVIEARHCFSESDKFDSTIEDCTLSEEPESSTHNRWT